MIVTKLIAATVAGAAFGAGALALAPSQAATGESAKPDHPRAASIAKNRNVIHADWTTRNKVRHQAIRGTVTKVSSRAVTVRAVDARVETYSVSSATKVRVVGDGHKGLDAIGDVKVGQRALVVGKGNHQATHLVARTPKKTSS